MGATKLELYLVFLLLTPNVCLAKNGLDRYVGYINSSLGTSLEFAAGSTSDSKTYLDTVVRMFENIWKHCLPRNCMKSKGIEPEILHPLCAKVCFDYDGPFPMWTAKSWYITGLIDPWPFEMNVSATQFSSRECYPDELYVRHEFDEFICAHNYKELYFEGSGRTTISWKTVTDKPHSVHIEIQYEVSTKLLSIGSLTEQPEIGLLTSVYKTRDAYFYFWDYTTSAGTAPVVHVKSKK